MAYRFELRERIAAGFVRIATEQIDRVARDLSADGDCSLSIHESRKSLKRLRALLRLVRPSLGESAYKAANGAFRDIGALFAGDRDRHVLRTVAQSCAESMGARYRKAFAAVEQSLAAPPVEPPAAAARRKDALARLAAMRRKISRLALEPDRFATIAAGLELSYRRGRRQLRRAYAHPSDEAFHDLRKAIQQQWRHMQVLQRAWPDLFVARLTAARHLSQLLGDDHDLAVFAAYLETLPRPAVSAADRRAILRHCRERQLALRTEAHPLCQQLYAEGPHRFARRITVIWREAERLAELKAERERPAKKPSSRPARKRPAALPRPGNSAQTAKVPARSR